MKNLKKIALIAFLFIGTVYVNAQTINLTSTGEIKVIPNIASTTILIEKTEKDPVILKKEIIKESENLNKQLHKSGIKENDIQTSNLQINKKYSWDKGQKEFTGYSASISTHVVFRKISKLASIYTQLLNNTSININGLQYSHSNQNELENEAYLKALENADILANALMSKTSFSSKEIAGISNSSNHQSQPSPMFKTANFEAISDSAPITINAGLITYSKTLNVTYNLK